MKRTAAVSLLLLVYPVKRRLHSRSHPHQIRARLHSPQLRRGLPALTLKLRQHLLGSQSWRTAHQLSSD